MNSFTSTLAAARTGDQAAYRRIYESLSQRIAGFAAARGSADTDAIVNETFLRAFQRLDQFDGSEQAFTGWVFTIARNVTIDEHRRTQRRPKKADVELPETLTVDTADLVVDREAVARVDRILQTLTADQRDVIALRLIADLSLDQVAEIVGKPVTAVKRLQARGLRQLQKRILDEEVS